MTNYTLMEIRSVAEYDYNTADGAIANTFDDEMYVVWNNLQGHPINLVIGGKVYEVVSDDDSDGEGDEDDE